MSKAMIDQALREKLASDFIDSIAVLTPHTWVTREAKRRLVATLTQYGDTRERLGQIDEIERTDKHYYHVMDKRWSDYFEERLAELKEKA